MNGVWRGVGTAVLEGARRTGELDLPLLDVAEPRAVGTASDRFEVASAGTEKTRVHPMAEAGIDLSSHASKTLDAFVAEPFRNG
jgi:hypothetical protein